jgi:carbon storage regulator
MNIITVPFEEYLTICVNNEVIKLVTFKTVEHGNIKFGVEASKNVKVHREEIYLAIKEKEKLVVEEN